MAKAIKKIGIALLVIVAVGSYAAATQTLKDHPLKESVVARIENEALRSRSFGGYIDAHGIESSSLLDLSGSYTLRPADGEVTRLGTATTDTIEWSGGANGAELRVLGEGRGTIRAGTDGELKLKNFTIVDETTDGGSGWESYLAFGGKLQFVNCTFSGPIYLEQDAEATFVNCRFQAPEARKYSVWVADGSARMESCEFTGTRGLKIHEFEGGDDVVNVTVKNCKFLSLTEKPGIAIGGITVNPMQTTIAIYNSLFQDCQPWDTVGSLVGIDGFYEADTPLEEFVFIDENNVVENTK